MSAWTRSSFCGSGACLEAMRTGPVVLVQDSKRPASSGGPLQAWSLGEWDELLGALLAGVPHPGVEPIGGGVRLGLKFPADRHEPLIFDRLEWGAFCNGVIAGEFEPDKLSSGVALELSSPAPALSGGTPEGGTTGPVPVKPLSVEGKDGHDPRDPGEPYLPGGAQFAATGAGAIAVPPAPVAAQPPYGEIVVRRIEPVEARYIVEQAPARSLVALEVLLAADSRQLYVQGDVMYLGDDGKGSDIAYQVTGWDAQQRALIVERRQDLDTPSLFDPFEDVDAELARAAAPLVDHNPETLADSRPRGAADGPSVAGSGEADPVTQAPGAGSAEPKPLALDAGICRCGADGHGPGDNRCVCRRGAS